jgi:hypothetical protein
MNARILILLGLLTWAIPSGRAQASRPDLGPYAIILQRQPFGVSAPAPTAPLPNPMEPGPDAFIKTLRMCAITDTPAGTRVGLVDLKTTPPKTYFLYVGDTEEGLELVDADYTSEKALLRKGSEEYWITMAGVGDASGGGNPATVGGATSSAVATAPALSSQNARRLSYADRVRKRREAEQQRMQELASRPPISPEEMEKTLQQIQMDVIRRGEPALPIPLTPEMDDQLVAEGVLPPAP